MKSNEWGTRGMGTKEWARKNGHERMGMEEWERNEQGTNSNEMIGNYLKNQEGTLSFFIIGIPLRLTFATPFLCFTLDIIF